MVVTNRAFPETLQLLDRGTSCADSDSHSHRDCHSDLDLDVVSNDAAEPWPEEMLAGPWKRFSLSRFLSWKTRAAQ